MATATRDGYYYYYCYIQYNILHIPLAHYLHALFHGEASDIRERKENKIEMDGMSFHVTWKFLLHLERCHNCYFYKTLICLRIHLAGACVTVCSSVLF